MLDVIKDYVPSVGFSIVAYLCMVIHFHCGVVFSAITAALRLREMDTFSCAVNTSITTYKSYVEKTCFHEYDLAYNSPMGLSNFVVFSVGTVVLASSIYWLAVRKWIDQTEKYSSPLKKFLICARHKNVRRKIFYVFYFYLLHLVVRFVICTLSVILQQTWLYPNGFETDFGCVYQTSPIADLNKTAGMNASVGFSSVVCTNFAARDKLFYGKIVFAYNVIFAIFAAGELIIYLALWLRLDDIHPLSNGLLWSYASEFTVVYFLQKQYEHARTDFIGVVLDKATQAKKLLKKKILNVSPTSGTVFRPNTNVDDLFININIHIGQYSPRFPRKLVRHEVYEVYMEHSIPLEKTTGLFHANEDTKGKSPRTIVVLGRPGTGKTVLTRKIMFDWAADVDRFYSDKIAFFFKVRWFHFEELQSLSLEEFLQFGSEMYLDEFEACFEDILLGLTTVICIFDGLDELGGDFDNYLNQSEMFPSDLSLKAPAVVFMIKILFGHLLPSQSIVLVTSRTAAHNVYSKLPFDRTVEISGFSASNIEKYVENFCYNYYKASLNGKKSANARKSCMKEKIVDYILLSSHVKNLCHTPANCFVVCVTLLSFLSDPSSNTGALPATLTELYQNLVIYLRKHHDRNEEGPYVEVFKNLQQLAFHGIQKDQLIFRTELLNEQMEKSALLNVLSGPVFQTGVQFCFIHFTVQEFLAAKHIVETKTPEEIEKFVSSHVKHIKWHLVLLFVAGLLAEKLKTSDEYRCCVSSFTQYLKCRCGEDSQVIFDLNPDQISAMKFVYEMQDESIAKQTAENFALENVTKVQTRFDNLLLPSDWAAVVFVCKHLKRLTDLSIHRIKNMNCLLEVQRLLRGKCMSSLKFLDCGIDDWGLQHVLDALLSLKCHVKHEHSNLTELNLAGGNKITDAGVERLSLLLSNDVCSHLADLDLSTNPVGDRGASILCQTLIRNRFQLGKLDLAGCSLTKECLEMFAIVLEDEHCHVKDLSLAFNHIDDEISMERFSGALRKKQCSLSVLSLSRCSLTDECIRLLCDSLGDEYCRLTSLDLSHNAFRDTYISLLTESLEVEHCSLEYLNISSNPLSEQSKRLLKEIQRIRIIV